MKSHLRFDMSTAVDQKEFDHPQNVMEKLGIKYQHATPQSIADQWWFWNCENLPEELPSYLSVLDFDPVEYIGFGLSKEDAEKISSERG